METELLVRDVCCVIQGAIFEVTAKWAAEFSKWT